VTAVTPAGQSIAAQYIAAQYVAQQTVAQQTVEQATVVSPTAMPPPTPTTANADAALHGISNNMPVFGMLFSLFTKKDQTPSNWDDLLEQSGNAFTRGDYGQAKKYLRMAVKMAESPTFAPPARVSVRQRLTHSLNQLRPSEMKRSVLYGVEFDTDPDAYPEIV
jgi:hypothetical protein